MLIRNLSKFSRRVRITQPKTFKFKCDYDMKPGIAAGLAMTLVVFFETDFKGDFHDVIKITSDDKFEYELKIHALQPKSKIFFDQFLNLGFCKLSQSKEDKIPSPMIRKIRSYYKFEIDYNKKCIKCNKLNLFQSPDRQRLLQWVFIADCKISSLSHIQVQLEAIKNGTQLNLCKAKIYRRIINHLHPWEFDRR